jgi:hypothetical protein
MNTVTVALARLLLVAAVFAMPSFAADDEEEALKKDLTAVIALHGQPCGEVVAVKVLAQDDYAATCKDKNKYHVYLNAAGRVIVEKQK